MSRISERFKLCRNENRKALIGFMTAGDPSPKDSAAILETACSAGLDLLELGVPFSDATADGPVLQKAGHRALRTGTSLRWCLEEGARLRNNYPDLPIILFGYFNPILSYGPKRFINDALMTGIDGLLCVDLPFERFCEVNDFIPHNRSFDLITLVSPSTTEERMDRILPGAKGFIYVQSRAGVTGIRKETDSGQLDSIRHRVDCVRRRTNLPIVVGFGISTPEQAAAIGVCCDGVVVGSALVHLVEKHFNTEQRRFDCAKAGTEVFSLIKAFKL